MNRPSAAKINLAHELVDAGCDLILGSHPHVIQGIETYKGRTIAYSLGNFVFSMKWKPARVSMLLKTIIAEDGQQHHEIIPVWIDDRYRPEVVKGDSEVNTVIEAANQLLTENPLNGIEYERLVTEALAEYQLATRVQFLKGIPKMSPFVALQLIMEFVLRALGPKENPFAY